jgi:hypothetical protein
MSSRSVILAAHVIKFGLPFGFLLAASNLISAALFREGGITAEAVGQSIAILVLIILGSLVLGLIRIGKNDV